MLLRILEFEISVLIENVWKVEEELQHQAQSWLKGTFVTAERGEIFNSRNPMPLLVLSLAHKVTHFMEKGLWYRMGNEKVWETDP